LFVVPRFRLLSGIGLHPRASPDYLISGDLRYSALSYTSHKQLLVSSSGEEPALSSTTAPPQDTVTIGSHL
jgi:hypothetical protein